MTLTHQLIHSVKSPAGGWTREQLKLLGIGWPPKRGWLSSLAGKSISDSDWERVVLLGAENLRSPRGSVRANPGYADTEVGIGSITVCFDGGVRPTNPGNKYGSYEVLLNGTLLLRKVRFELGWGTNNEAEFEALIAAVLDTYDRLAKDSLSPKDFYATAITDSMVVRNRICGGKRSRKTEPEQRMASYADRVHAYVAAFGKFAIKWERRDVNVKRFGH